MRCSDKQLHAVALRRLSGLPDENGSFPNLKTLRDYCARTGDPTSKYRFDVQVGKIATDREKAKIYSEQHHLEEMERRLTYEEDAFAARRRGEAQPKDYFEGGQVERSPTTRKRRPKNGAEQKVLLFNRE